jgi:hypothetical protein
MEKAKMKMRHDLYNDPNDPPRTVVLWVGEKSPEGVDIERCYYTLINPNPKMFNCNALSYGAIPFTPK